MTKKRLLLIASVPLTIAVTLGVLALLPPSPGITKANFDRIEKGMTRAEVEGVFGGKGDWRWIVMDREEKSEWMWGSSDKANAVINFEKDCVTEKQWSGSDESFFDKIRRWLHVP